MNVADRFLEILEEENVTEVFGIPGEQIMPLYKALSKSHISHILTAMNRPPLMQLTGMQDHPERLECAYPRLHPVH